MAVNLNAITIVNKWRTDAFSTHKHNSLCCLCGVTLYREDSGLCRPCTEDLPKNNKACPRCAIPMSANMLCPGCLQQPNHNITNIFTLYKYQYPINRLIQEMKYMSRTDIACSMGKQLGFAVQERGLHLPQCVIPVPLHSSRVAGRGYNQSVEIARPLANILNIPIDLKICKRIFKTFPQTGLSASHRKRNIHGAFRITHASPYDHIVIIDDVVTTGATVNEMASVLVRSGAKRIDVWACARASC